MHTGVRTLRLAALANSSQSPCKPKARNGACTEKKTVSELIYKKGRQGTWILLHSLNDRQLGFASE